MSWLRWSYRIGFVIAGIAVIVCVAGLVLIGPPLMQAASGPARDVASNTVEIPPEVQTPAPAPQVQTPATVLDASLTVLISGVTCLVTTIGSFSAMLLAWRLDRRQSRETALRIAQLQVDLERSRQVKAEQS
jgi:hypothetical protein